jgi:hypothetical protein
MGFLKNLEAYAEEKKYENDLKKISKRLRDNPKNDAVMRKLEQLYREREAIKVSLEKKEVEIDFCLHFLYYNDL